MPSDFFPRMPDSSDWPGGVLGRWGVPARVELDTTRDRLLIDRFGDDALWHNQEKTSRKLLDEFIALANTDDAKVLEFARKWGVLDLCQHGLPCWHPPGQSPNQPGAAIVMAAYGLQNLYTDPAPISPWWPESHGFLRYLSPAERHLRRVYKSPFPDWDRDGVTFITWEPLDEWRSWSRRASALVTAAQCLHDGQPAPEKVWRTAMIPARHWIPPKTLDAGWHELSFLLTSWLALAQITPIVRSPGYQGVTLELPARGLFGALTLQLLFAATKRTGFLSCCECGMPYTGKRRPKAGNKNYCPECRKGRAAARNRMREERRKARKS